MAEIDKERPAPLAGPARGEFVAPPEIPERDEAPDALPAQEDFWRPPVRFGSVPVEKEPLGWDRRRGYRKLYPLVLLPTQVVERVSFGRPDLAPNRLLWGDNLHVMRQLPSESIDLIYIDPPFFSGRQYNVIFGDRNELRSFSDIWEGGMPGYLVWLNARLYEMKRLLKKSGSIYVHLDWHAVFYVKMEMDKILGVENFRNAVVWHYVKLRVPKWQFSRNYDTVLFYTKSSDNSFHQQREKKAKLKRQTVKVWDKERKTTVQVRDENGKLMYYDQTDRSIDDVWNIQLVNPVAKERMGYPTQKPEALLERIILASSNPGDVVADFFCGGGTAPAVAQRLGRRWLACDQSRVAVALTADRLTRAAQQGALGETDAAVPDFTVEHWGVYEARRLSQTPPAQFREFVLRAFGAVPEAPSPPTPLPVGEGRGDGQRSSPPPVGEEAGAKTASPLPGGRGGGGEGVRADAPQGRIHGWKGAVPIWVGEPDQRSQVTSADVLAFANAVRRTPRYQQDNLRDGIMLAWAYRQDALAAAQRLREREQTDMNFVRLEQVRIDSPRFREHVAALSTDNADYANFLTFVQPPRVEVGWARLKERSYRFDVSETAVLNPGARIINVQWDFAYDERFTSTPGYSFIRGAKKEPALQAEYTFPRAGACRIACKVQDDLGGEGLWVGEISAK